MVLALVHDGTASTLLATLPKKLGFVHIFCRGTYLKFLLGIEFPEPRAAAFDFSSSVLVSAHVPQFYNRTDLTNVLYSLILVRCLVLSALCHICSILFNAVFDRCFPCSMSSLLPSSEPTFFDVFHSSECFFLLRCTPFCLH